MNDLGGTPCMPRACLPYALSPCLVSITKILNPSLSESSLNRVLIVALIVVVRRVRHLPRLLHSHLVESCLVGCFDDGVNVDVTDDSDFFPY